MEELKQLGEFKDGVFRRREPLFGKKNPTATRRSGSIINSARCVYPKPRYPQPIMMDPTNFDWVPVEGAPGVSEKLLGVFTERRSEVGLVEARRRRAYTARGKGIFLVVRGAGTVGGRRCASSPRSISSAARP